MAFAIPIDKFAEGMGGGGLHVRAVIHAALHGFLHFVPRAGGAVVVEEVIAVDAVLRPVIFFQQGDEAFFIFLGQVEDLLPDVPSIIIVGMGEIISAALVQPVIRLPQGEAQDEASRAEVEDTIIIDHVRLSRQVLAPNGGMSEEGVDFFARLLI